MLESNKKIWEKLEENIGHCILFRDAALKEILGEESFTLQFATLTVPEKVEAFLEGNENIKIIRNETCNYLFAMDGTRIEIHCFDSKFGFEISYRDMFDRAFRCENLGINLVGQYNKNIDAYKDIMAKELHLASADTKLTEFMIGKLVRYVLISNFSVGDDILEHIKSNNVFESKSMRNRFLGAFADCVRKNKCTWERTVEALKLIEGILPSADFIQYTASLNEEVKNDKFIRNYLYNLFISLDMNAQELQKIMPNEPTLEYFDSLAINASACLGRYDIYLEIKDKYGDEFLELLMDVQECIAMSLGMEYTRVTEETFDMGAMFFKDERFWCSSEEIKNSTDVAEERVVSQQKDEMIDVSKGNVTTWTNDQYLEEMYSDESENDDEKHYLDDDDVEEKTDTGLNMSEIDSYEGEELLDDKGEASSKSPAIVAHDDEIMNSQRGHESKVLNSGGM